MKQYIDLMTPMEAYQKGYDKGQEDVCTVGVSDIYEKGELAGIKKVVEWTAREFGVDWSHEKEQLKEWGIKNENCND